MTAEERVTRGGQGDEDHVTVATGNQVLEIKVQVSGKDFVSGIFFNE